MNQKPVAQAIRLTQEMIIRFRRFGYKFAALIYPMGEMKIGEGGLLSETSGKMAAKYYTGQIKRLNEENTER